MVWGRHAGHKNQEGQTAFPGDFFTLACAVYHQNPSAFFFVVFSSEKWKFGKQM